MSDISRSIGVSAALAINCGGFSGTGKGAFINEDIVQNSDIFFIVRSKVINRYDPIKRRFKFNSKAGITKENFLANYGDCFVSNFEEGGEFLALVNVSISDSVDKKSIEGEIEAGLRAIEVKGSGDFTSDLRSKAKFSISVYAIGGKPLKPDGGAWNITSMLKAATDFPQQVSTNSAVLSVTLDPYTTADGFFEAMKGYEPASYTVALRLTASWLDDFTSFKTIISDISKMKENLDGYIKAPNKTDAYELNLESLDNAVDECNAQRSLITKNVDAVTRDPKLAIASRSDKDDKFKYTKPGQIRDRLPAKKNVTQSTLTSLSGSSIVCCNVLEGETKCTKLYWQHENGSIMESTCKNLEWSLEQTMVATSAMPNTPLAAVFDPTSTKTRVFYMSKGRICELFRAVNHAVWIDGEFVNPTATNSPITNLAVYRQPSGRLHLFYQDQKHKLIHEVFEPGATEWAAPSGIPEDQYTMVSGSSLTVLPGVDDWFSVVFQGSDANWIELVFDPTTEDAAKKWKKAEIGLTLRLCRPGNGLSSTFLESTKTKELVAIYPSNEIWMTKYENDKWSDPAHVGTVSASGKVAINHGSSGDCRIYASKNRGVVEMTWDDSKKVCKVTREAGMPILPA